MPGELGWAKGCPPPREQMVVLRHSVTIITQLPNGNCQSIIGAAASANLSLFSRILLPWELFRSSTELCFAFFHVVHSGPGHPGGWAGSGWAGPSGVAGLSCSHPVARSMCRGSFALAAGLAPFIKS